MNAARDRRMPCELPAWLLLPLASLLLAAPVSASDEALVRLGSQLYFDTDLSRRRTQSCATCHAPERGFADPRDNGVGGAASRGDDGVALGSRQAPSIAYAAQVPRFTRDADGARGGLFHDGRADTLEAQAAEPLLNPLEMALPDRATAVARLREKPAYRSAFEQLFGTGILDDTQAAYDALTRALAAFERSSFFATYDSRYDRFLAGELELTIAEELGRRVFFSDLTNCMNCHLLEPGTVRRRESFTDHRYHNIGIPPNPRLRAAGAISGPDGGLARRPGARSGDAGRFRTPTLRNVAVTAPYMHNGVFAELDTAIRFYNRYLVINDAVEINPETGASWGEAEISANLALDRLRQGQPLTAARIGHLVSFLRALTDRRYEHLLPPRPDLHQEPHDE